MNAMTIFQKYYFFFARITMMPIEMSSVTSIMGISGKTIVVTCRGASC
jgi:hypothetical protein